MFMWSAMIHLERRTGDQETAGSCASDTLPDVIHDDSVHHRAR